MQLPEPRPCVKKGEFFDVRSACEYIGEKSQYAGFILKKIEKGPMRLMTANSEYPNRTRKRFSILRFVVLALFTGIGTSIGWAIGSSMFLLPQLAGVGRIYFLGWGIAMIVGGVCGSLVAGGLTREEIVQENPVNSVDSKE